MILSLLLKLEEIQAILGEASGKEFKIIEGRSLKREELSSFIREKKIEKVRISINSEDILHEIYHFPPAKPRLISKLIEREIEGVIAEGFQYKFEILGDIRDGEHLKRKVSVIAIPHLVLEDAVLHPKLPIEWITSYPVSIRALLERVEISESPSAFIELSNDAVDILILKDREIRIVRRLPPLDKEEEVGNLIRDILQTIFFHKQRFRGESVEKIIVTGERFKEEIVDTLNRDLEMPVITLYELPEEAAKFPGAYGNFLIEPRSPFLFLPATLKKKRLVERISLGLIIFALIIFTFEGHRILSKESELRSNVKYMENLERLIKEKEVSLAQLKKEVVEYQVKEAQPEWKDILMEIGAVIPRGAFLKNLHLKREGGRFIGEASGEIERGDPLDKMMLINLLRERLSFSPLLINPSLTHEVDGEKITFTIRFLLPSGESVR